MRAEIFGRIHEGHQGLNKCRDRANISMWWPGIASQTTHKVENCMRRAQNRDTLVNTSPRPAVEENRHRLVWTWQRQYPHSRLLLQIFGYTSHANNNHGSCNPKTKSDICTVWDTRGGCQRQRPTVQQWYRDFACEWDFQQTTSSPHNPQGNGHAVGRAVQTAKRIIQQKDPLLALMIYRSSPHSSTGVSPVEHLMGRPIRTTLPTLAKNLQPKWPGRQWVQARDTIEKEKQTYYYNKRHVVRQLCRMVGLLPVYM